MKAVIPVAGFGTRMLPATKAIPKEMLTVADKPLIQYIVQECVAAGITDIILVNHSSKTAVANHFNTVFELETLLKNKGKFDLLEVLQVLISFKFIRVRPMVLDRQLSVLSQWSVMKHLLYYFPMC